MLRQPGFMVMALYTGWIYAQIVLVIVLLGSLTSKYYSLRSPLVGLCVAFISIGGFVAIPFQKANLFSRGRHHQDTLDTTFSWTSHLLRRAIFSIFLPLVGIAYTVASAGPPIPVEVPTLFAALIGTLSGLAISECNGLIMETFDTSDLPLSSGVDGNNKNSPKHTNYSSFPRVTAGFAVCHTIGFVLAAIATAVGGQAQRHLGQQAATGVVAGILFILTLLLLAVLIRFKDMQMIPTCKTLEMEKWTKLRRASLIRRRSEAHSNRSISNKSANPDPDPDLWRPILLGNPSAKMRRMNILELGALSRWTEIRKVNRLIDETAGAHLNRAALESAAEAVEEATGKVGAATGALVRRVSRRSQRSRSRSRRGRWEEERRSLSPKPLQELRGYGAGGGEAGLGIGLFRPRSANPTTTAQGIELGFLGASKVGAASSYSLPDQFRGRGLGSEDDSGRDGVRGQTVVEEDDFVSFVSDGGDQNGLKTGHELEPRMSRKDR